MSADAEPAPASRRPDPFAFPSDTTFRFVLLVVAVLGASLFLYRGVYTSFISDRTRETAAYVACYDASGLAAPLTDLADGGPRAAAYNSCIAPVREREAEWLVTGLGLLVVVTLAIYAALPEVRIRRRRLRPLTASDAPDVVAELHELVRVAGLQRAPRFVWDPVDPSTSGVAFGRAGRRFVALGGGLVVRYYKDRAAFRAVVLHELAHIRNGDVDRTYLAVASWWAFVAAALVPFGTSLVGQDAGYVMAVLWRAAVIAALVWLLRTGVLRAREFYADARVLEWEPDGGGLRGVLAALPRRVTRSWRRSLSHHPEPAARERALDDPLPLFSLGLLDTLGTGVVATVAYANVLDLVTVVAGDQLAPHWLAALVFAPVAVGVVGVGIWRATYAARQRLESPPNGLLAGAALGGGLLLGQQLSFQQVIDASVDRRLGLGGVEPAWLLLVLASIALFGRWLAIGAAAWLPPGLDLRKRRTAGVVSVACAGGVLALWLGWLFFLRANSATEPVLAALTDQTRTAVSRLAWVPPEGIWLAVWHPLLVYFSTDSTGLVLVGGLIAVPLAGWLADRARMADHVRATLGIGVAGGGVCMAAILLMRLALHDNVSYERAASDGFRFGFFTWQLMLAFACQCLVAAIAAARGPEAGGFDGFVAAAVTGAIAGVAIVGSVQVATCVGAFSIVPGSAGPCTYVIDSGFLWDTTRQVVVEGLVYAIPAAVLGSLLVTMQRRFAPPAAPVPG